MNGRPSSMPLSSRVAKISEALRTLTSSPGLKSSIGARCRGLLAAAFTLSTNGRAYLQLPRERAELEFVECQPHVADRTHHRLFSAWSAIFGASGAFPSARGHHPGLEAVAKCVAESRPCARGPPTQPCAGRPRAVEGRRSAERNCCPPSCATTRRQSAGRSTIRGSVQTSFARRSAASLQGRPRAALSIRTWSLASALSHLLRRGSSGASSRTSMRRSKMICENRRTRSRPSDVTPCWAASSLVNVVWMDAVSGEGRSECNRSPSGAPCASTVGDRRMLLPPLGIPLTRRSHRFDT